MAGRWLGQVILLLGAGMMVAGLAGGMPAGAAPGASGGGTGGNKAARERGAMVFQEKGCGHCHGAELQGTDMAPSLQGVGRHLHKPQIEMQIRDGGKEMPAFGALLSAAEMKDLVEYLGAMKQKSAP